MKPSKTKTKQKIEKIRQKLYNIQHYLKICCGFQQFLPLQYGLLL